MNLKKRVLINLMSLTVILITGLMLFATWAIAEPPVTTVLNIDPDTLNLDSKGRWITAYLMSGQYYTWQHGFLPGPDALNHPDVTPDIGYDWYSYTSPNLMELTPGQNPVTKMWSDIPELILGVEVAGNGWDFHGKADSVVLSGIVGDSPTPNLIKNGEFNNGFDYWVKTSWKNTWNPSQFFWNIDTTEGTPAPSFDYERIDSQSDGGWVGIIQRMQQNVADWSSLTVSYNLKIISASLTDSGWWWTVNGGWGETPCRIVVHYMSNLLSEEIDPTSIKLYGIDTDNDGTADVVLNLPTVGPSDIEEGILMVKFDRQALINALRTAGLPNNSTIGIIVTGTVNETLFTAVDRIRVLTK